MERSSLSSSLKDHCIGSRSSCINDSKKKQDSNSNRLKDSWSYSRHNYGEDYLGGFPWPPRSYSCSFCKREFRSAQALGGHMNVHRRDRARLRQSPPSDGHSPILNLDLNPNPNPNPRFSPPLTCTLPSLVSPPLSALSSPSLTSPSKIKKWAVDGIPVEPLSPKAPYLTKTGIRESLFGAEEFDGVPQKNGCKLMKKGEYVRLDLEIGLPPDSMEDLDLELRLGFS